jgi:hypothetical protein
VLKKEDGASKIDETVYDTAEEPVQTLHAYLKDIVARALSASASAAALAQAPSGPRAADLGSG